MMIAIWAVVVAVMFAAIVRPWRAARSGAPLIGAGLAAAWTLYDGARIYADAIAQSMWTSATVTIPYVPAKALVLALLSYTAAAAVRDAARGDRRYRIAALVLVALFVAAVAAETRATIVAGHLRLARSRNLSVDEVAALTARIDSGQASPDEVSAFIGNPLCAPELLARFAVADPTAKIAVARNPAAPPELVTRLSNDPNASVRYYAAASRNLPATELPRLSHDPDVLVRDAVAWKSELPDDDFARLVNDPDPQVRSTAALQPRISTQDLRRLAEDPTLRVREAAKRKLAGR